MFSKSIILITITSLSLLLTACPAPTDVSLNVNNSSTNNSQGNTRPAGNSVNDPSPVDGKEITIADGRDESEPVAPPAAEAAIVEKAVEEKKAAIISQSPVECDDGAAKTMVLGSTSGAFTKVGASQKAYLFEYCRAGRSFGISGVVITEGSSVVGVYAFGRSAIFTSIGSIDDVNANGLKEVTLAGGGTGQGYTESTVTLFEFGDKRAVDLGRASTYSDNSGAASDNSKVVTTAYKITAESGTTPTFYRQQFEKRGGATTWTGAKAREKFPLDKSEGEGFKKIE